ncbi:hypothetical protein RJ640_001447 [Escallonia rubra]|uniref:NPF family transporter n=1 Tax=Escallonia rubra TaxID=112253 RepID=A0AA88UH12_9ASTE|nr:hypothetical protein RJ640_001447 [Escallonia rubra]
MHWIILYTCVCALFAASEICDRFAMVGFYANMITYLTQELNLPIVKASNILINFSGTGSLSLLVGALIADSFAGRFWTIIVGSIVYEVGLMTLTTSAVLPQFRPPPCPTQENCEEASAAQLTALYICLLLKSLGSGSIRGCVVAFAADQFDMKKSITKKGGWNFFNIYYFCMGISMLLAITVLVYIQDHMGWGWGLGIPTIVMALSIITFLVGSPVYLKVKPGGSPLTRLAQVIVAALRKRRAIAPQDPGLLYQNNDLDAAIATNGRLLHTNQFKWFDRAAILTDDDTSDSRPPNLWRLATVHRVEELKSIIRMLPIWISAMLFTATYANSDSFTILQARTMDRHLSPSFQIPPASLAVFGILTFILGIPLYEHIFVPFSRRLTGNPAGVTCLQRMGIGYILNLLGTIVSAVVEAKRKAAAADHGLLDKPTITIPLSVFWLIPQFCIGGIGDVFWAAGHLEFIYDQSPESMKSTVLALYWTVASMGSYIGSFMVSMVHRYTGKERNWLPDRNLNRGRLDDFYWLMAALEGSIFIYYVLCARLYIYNPLEEVKEPSKDGDVELAIGNIPYNAKNDANGLAPGNDAL